MYICGGVESLLAVIGMSFGRRKSQKFKGLKVKSIRNLNLCPLYQASKQDVAFRITWWEHNHNYLF
jgi:hypothetical protein